MTKNSNQDLINRYVYDVVRRLPQSQREDIEKEIKSLIEDMLNERGYSYGDNSVERVLYKLGKPSELADRYRENKRYIIGPENFDNFVFILKIVLISVFAGLTVARIIAFIAEPVGILTFIGLYIASIFNGLIMAFGFVTLWFYVYERTNTNKKDKNVEWKLKELPNVPEKGFIVKRGETIVSIIFTVVLIVIFNFALKIFGIISLSEEQIIIPLFNVEAIKEYLIAINVIFALLIANELIKFIVGKYTIKMASVITLINVLSIALTIYVFTNAQIWNSEFFEFIAGMGKPEGEVIEYAKLQKNLTALFPFIFIIPSALDTINCLFKGIKYSNRA